LVPLLGKIALERLGPLDMERPEVLVPHIGFEPRYRLSRRFYGLLDVSLSIGKKSKTLAFDPLVFGIVIRHLLEPSAEPQFTLGFTVSLMAWSRLRGRRCDPDLKGLLDHPVGSQ
jgi:hypothetical protein